MPVSFTLFDPVDIATWCEECESIRPRVQLRGIDARSPDLCAVTVFCILLFAFLTIYSVGCLLDPRMWREVSQCEMMPDNAKEARTYTSPCAQSLKLTVCTSSRGRARHS